MKCTKLLLLIFFTFFLSSFSQEEEVFGGSDKVTAALEGKVYKLPENTNHLPNFDNLRPVSTIYATELNIPNHDFSSGFPGVSELLEWFGIEYTGDIFVKKAGNYNFRLLSDDGAKLFINDSLVINNDGIHAATSGYGSIFLDEAKHRIKVQYFQGPRYHIALQLFYTFEEEKEQLFPGKEITLTIPSVYTKKGMWVLLFLIVLGGGIIFVQIKRKKK
ncbi:MAG: beta-glucosidase [Bacteroidetes bacterium]|nr:beta-glucosidase [Bacteroidota bacterium]